MPPRTLFLSSLSCIGIACRVKGSDSDGKEDEMWRAARERDLLLLEFSLTRSTLTSPRLAAVIRTDTIDNNPIIQHDTIRWWLPLHPRFFLIAQVPA